MVDLSNIAKLELESFTEIQRDFHIPDDPEGDEVDNSVTARYSANYQKTSWSTDFKVPMLSTQEASRVVYTADKKAHFLINTKLRINLPELEIHPDYKGRIQICWPHNAALSFVVEAYLCNDNKIVLSLDDISNNIIYQYYTPKSEQRSIALGNIPFLEEWNDYLPAFTLIADQPWYYGTSESLAFPLFYLKDSTITHKYTFRSKLKDFLRMRKLVNVEEKDPSKQIWKEITYNPKMLLDPPAEIPTPQLWARYGFMMDHEIKERMAEWTDVFYVKDMLQIPVNDPKAFDTSCNINFKTLLSVRAVFFLAQTQEAVMNRNYSNFTTNPNSYTLGWNPIGSSKVVYGISERTDEWDHFMTEIDEALERMPYTPTEPGYNVIAFCNEKNSKICDPGIPLQHLRSELIIKLSDTNPFLPRLEKEQQRDPFEKGPGNGTPKDDPLFNIHVRVLVTKKLVFDSNGLNVVIDNKIFPLSDYFKEQ